MLEIKGVKKSYGEFQLDCSLNVEKGRITGLVGENGAGKSTLFKAVLGLISYDAGEIKILGKTQEELSEKEKEELGVVLAEAGFTGYLKGKILISSHISSDLEHLCDDIYVIHKGKIVLHEEMDTILEKYAVLKVSEEQYQAMDKRYLLKEKKEFFGIVCLTNEKQYYMENYPEIVVESGSLDQVILMLTGGER